MTAREELESAVDELAAFAAELKFSDVPARARERVEFLLTDLWGVTVAGADTPEMVQLFAAWPTPAGDAPILGRSQTTIPDNAAFLNAVSACLLELDEGNKHSQGHPAVHVVFAAMAAVQWSDRRVTGEEFLVAIIAGYEVAARFGRAPSRNAEWHTHGHWGAVGAACAAALIAREPVERIAAAMDASGGLMTVTPWAMVLDGNFTRNLWVAAASTAGLQAARLAGAGLVANSGALDSSLGAIVGTLDATSLLDGLGSRWFITEGYIKSHSSCAYTHGAIDVIQGLKTENALVLREANTDVVDVLVTTTSLAQPLFHRNAYNRLSAMFSFPFVVAAALLNESVDPAAMDPTGTNFDLAAAFSARVRMATSTDFDRLLPTERWVRVEMTLADGSILVAASANPIGDADNSALGMAQIVDKLRALIEPDRVSAVVRVVAGLLASIDVKSTLSALGPSGTTMHPNLSRPVRERPGT